MYLRTRFGRVANRSILITTHYSDANFHFIHSHNAPFITVRVNIAHVENPWSFFHAFSLNVRDNY